MTCAFCEKRAIALYLVVLRAVTRTQEQVRPCATTRACSTGCAIHECMFQHYTLGLSNIETVMTRVEVCYERSKE